MENKKSLTAIVILEKLKEHYNVKTATEVSLKLGISQPSMSKAIKNDNVKYLLKKIREVGIFNEIMNYVLTMNV